MKKYVIVLATIGLLANATYAQNLKISVPQAKTKLEQLDAKTGVVLIRGYLDMGSVQGLYSTSVSVSCKEIINVSDGKKQYGIVMRVKKATNEYVSSIDYDELESLIKSIDYMLKVKSDVANFENIQIYYSTKDYLQIRIVRYENKVSAQITSGTSGNIAERTAIFNIEDLEKNVKKLLLKAKETIEAIKDSKSSQ